MIRQGEGDGRPDRPSHGGKSASTGTTEVPIAEQWRPVPGFSAYLISDIGRVISNRRRRQRFLHPNIGTEGYRVVGMARDDGKRITRKVHALVAEAFIGPRPDEMQVCHRDGDQLNNCVDNLYYGTVGDNARDRVRHGRDVWGTRTECVNGHPWTDENTRRRSDRKSRSRICRACDRERARTYAQRRALRAAGVAA